jgi:hypothetical protein
MSQLEVDKIIPQSGTTLTIGDSGDTITVASGATLTGDLNADNLTSGTVPTARISGAYTGITQTGTLTNSGAPVSTFNRTTNDGTIIDLRKDGTIVGSIGNFGDNLGIESVDVGLLFLSGSSEIIPTGGNFGVSDNTKDLGRSSTRFKDLYLGGGLYVGGTAAANKLDDYEEGTFTPTFTSTSASFSYSQQYGFYTKIGRSVTCHIFIRAQSSGTTSNSLFISGLPFTSLNSSGLYASGSFGQIESVDYPAGALEITGHVSPNNTQISLQYSRDDNSALGLPASAVDAGTSSGFMFSINYFTD